MPTSIFCCQLHCSLSIHRQYRGNHQEDDHCMATLKKPCGGAEHFIHMDEVCVEAAQVFRVRLLHSEQHVRHRQSVGL